MGWTNNKRWWRKSESSSGAVCRHIRRAVDTERGFRESWLREARRSYVVVDVRAAIEGLIASSELADASLYRTTLNAR
jgi:hypothetical protein